MNKKEIIKYLKDELDKDKDYTYLVVDMRDWKEDTPDVFTAWKMLLRELTND